MSKSPPCKDCYAHGEICKGVNELEVKTSDIWKEVNNVKAYKLDTRIFIWVIGIVIAVLFSIGASMWTSAKGISSINTSIAVIESQMADIKVRTKTE